MMTRILQTILLATALTFTITVQAGEAEDAIKDAKAAQMSAKSVDGEWRDTGKMIKKAEKLLAAGETDKAIKQARMAEAQGMLGHIQATTQGKLHI